MVLVLPKALNQQPVMIVKALVKFACSKAFFQYNKPAPVVMVVVVLSQILVKNVMAKDEYNKVKLYPSKSHQE